MTLRELNPFNKKSVPVRREDEHPISLFRHDMDRLFEDFWRGFDVDPFLGRHISSFSPRIDVTENDKEIRISAELPGVDEKNIDLTLDNHLLTIKGEKNEEKEDKGKDYYRMERSYGSFCRTIPLPTEIQSNKASASYKKGILTVKIPKSRKAIEEKKKIQVKVD